jgi:hypothetical protein
MERRWVIGFFASACLLVLAGPVLAAEQPWLAQMPSVDKVVAATQGSDASDTAARQWVAFERLFSMKIPLIGDRFVTNETTPAERALFDSYNTKRDQVLAALKASLPAEEREFYVGTKFAQWSALRDRYFADQQFTDQLAASLFSADFRRTQAQVMTDKWRAYPGGLGLTPTPRPPLIPTSVSAIGGLFGLVVVGFVIPILLKRGRMELDGKDAFKLHLGGRDYGLVHFSGLVEHPSKMASTNVYSSGGGGSWNASGGSVAPVTVSSSTTVHDQFFLRGAGDRVESIQLSGWDFPVAEGHVVSAVWAIPEGSNSGPYVMLRNHTTRDNQFHGSYLNAHVMRWSGFGLTLLEWALAIAAGVVAAPVVGLPQGIAAALVGVFLGSAVWHFTVKPRFLARFRRVGVPRLTSELDRVAGATPVPA